MILIMLKTEFVLRVGAGGHNSIHQFCGGSLGLAAERISFPHALIPEFVRARFRVVLSVN